MNNRFRTGALIAAASSLFVPVTGYGEQSAVKPDRGRVATRQPAG